MLKSLNNWLQKPYYFNPSIKFKFKLSLVFGFLVFLFLYLFQPFTLSTFKNYIFVYTLSIGIITFVGNFTILNVLPLLFKNYFNEDNWTIGRNIVLIFIVILSLGSILWYNGYLFKLNKGIPHISYLTFIYYSFLVGTFPILFGLYLNEKILREKREYKAKEINAQKNSVNKKIEIVEINETVHIKSKNKNEELEFIINDLIYITSQGNYTSFFIKNNNNELEEKVLRITLNKTVEHLKKYSNIVRCHKSYIINTNYITKVSGNARGYLLQSDLISFNIPVSRSFSKTSITDLLKQ
ncbi:LytTR family DNA-binding domain-containing protein [Polaribacter porphyrae]|uniref:HTH LytTR-type domain-containing protein n=1 Tax=Polaribacter porphyrae TaxID=1137780 RepID=A0A2S7WQS4_9FLAO|nr:LytTR family DNA-binding domain-containing protein [Polaribacter porphyrae]PQJ79968.1 hypothetical protein BTO18_12645 [Polaribacter porphyrae]